jgi:protein disulfide isomerase
MLYIVEPGAGGVKKYRGPSEVTGDSIKKFVADWKAKTISPVYKSAEIPAEPFENGVRVVVGKNFDEVVMDTTKDVLVEFYAPWCGHCKKLAPEYEAAAERLKTIMPDALLVKCDATANEIPDHPVQGFPTLKFFAANKKTPIEYNDNRDADGIVNFFKKNGSTKIVEEPAADADSGKKDEL